MKNEKVIVGWDKNLNPVTSEDVKRDPGGWDMRCTQFSEFGTMCLETRVWASQQANYKKQRQAGLN